MQFTTATFIRDGVRKQNFCVRLNKIDDTQKKPVKLISTTNIILHFCCLIFMSFGSAFDFLLIL